MYDQSQTKQLWEHPTGLVYEKKLDTALRDTSVRILKTLIHENSEDEYTFDMKLFLSLIDRESILESKTDNSCYAALLSKIISDSSHHIIYGSNKGKNIKKGFEAAKENLKFQHGYNTSNNFTHMKNNATKSLNENLDKLQPDNLILNLMHVIDIFRKIIDKKGFMNRVLPQQLSTMEKIELLSKEGFLDLDCIETKIKWSKFYAYIQTSNDAEYVLPSSYLLLIHNKLADFISTYMLCKTQANINLQENSLDVFMEFMTEMVKLSIKYKDKFAEITGSLEGLVIGEILMDVEEWENDDLLNNIINDLKESIGFDYTNSKLRLILRKCEIPLRNEIGCCSKLFGHPFVDMEGGARKLHQRTTHIKTMTYDSINWVVNKAKETFVINYLTRHGKWPPVLITCEYPGKDPLMRAMLSNKFPDHPSIVNKYGKVDMKDWNRVELQEILKFQQLENIIPFLKDKSISILRSAAVRHYIKFENYPRIKWEDTRLLLYYLLNPLKKLDHEEFIRLYAEDEGLELLADYLIIRIIPKEKEHKILFRGFGVKTYNDRLRSLTQEKNLAHFLSLYCDEQAMTLSELDISRRLYAIRTLIKAYRKHGILYINCDSQAWNNNFRKESVKPVIRETISRIHGNPFMDKIHEAYESSKILIADGDITFSWDGQQGGIDGLNQYSWVWVYVNQIKYAMKDLPIKYHMFCKGDDMRLAIIIKPELLLKTDMKSWHKRIMEMVSKTALEFGHNIKVQESYGSEKFFSFSKCASIGTIELPQAFRKIQKVYGANNAMINTLDEYIASSFSNAHSACRFSTNTYSCYFVSLFWNYYYLSIYDVYKDLTTTEFMSLLLIPNMLGGFPIIYLHNMRIRAESDLLSPFMDMLLYARQYNNSLFACLSKFLVQVIPQKRVMTKLYRDPYSLWISTPPLPTAILRSFILPVLRKIVKNEDIIDLIHASNSNISKKFIEALSSAEPQDAKVLSTIYAATPEGVLMELMKKFESGRSILDLLILKIGKKSADFKLRKVLTAETRLQRWRYNKLKNNEYNHGKVMINVTGEKCPTEMAQIIRNLTWNKTITGISMPPLRHQITLCTPLQAINDIHAQRNHFLYTYCKPEIFLYPGCSHHWGSGGQQPFLGYTTRTGNIAPSVSFLEKDPLIIKAKNLLDICSWINKEFTHDDGTVTSSNLIVLVKDILSLYTDISTDELSPFASVRKSGTIQHHARAPRFRESIVPNTLSNMYQNMTGNSDSHIALRESNMHFTINFLHIMCECIHQCMIELETCSVLTTSKIVWGVTTDCLYCSTPINEQPIVIQNYTPITSVTGVLNSCRIDQISKKLILNSFTDFNENQFKNPALHDAPSSELAVLGVASEFVQHHKKIHNNLQNRFTHHVLSSQAHNTLVNMTHGTTSRTIGQSEIKKLSNLSITLALLPLINDFVMNQFIHYDDAYVILEMEKVHTSELLWVPLIDHLWNSGKLGSYIAYLSRLSQIQHPPCYENVMNSSAYIGAAIFKIIREAKLPLSICIRSWMDKDSTTMELDGYIMPYKWKLLNIFFFELTKQWRPGCEDRNLMVDICRQGVYVCAMTLNTALITQNLFDVQEPNVLHEYDLNRYVDLELEHVTNLYEEPDTQEGRMLTWLKSKFVSWPWDAVEDEIRNNYMDDEVIIKLCRGVDNLRVRIGISDIASCIMGVRSSVMDEDDLVNVRISDDEFSNIDIKRENIAAPMEITIRKTPKNRRILNLKSEIIERAHLSQHQATELDFSSNKIILDNAHSHRLYGSGTTSQSKLDEILDITGIYRLFPQGIKIMCLADGYGGFVEYLSTCTTYSHIIFNTLATRIGRNIFPYSSLWSLLVNHNKVDTSVIDKGYDDLTQESTKIHYIRNYSGVSIVTNDADIKWEDKNAAKTLLYNVIEIFLMVGTPDALLVSKCNLGYASHVINCMSVLRKFCTNVFLVRSIASNSGGEVYIVAQGINRCPHLPIIFEASDAEIGEIDQFSHYMHGIFTTVNAGLIDIMLNPSIPRSIRHKLHDLKSSITSKLFSRLAIDLDFDWLCTTSICHLDIIIEIITHLNTTVKFYNEYLLRDNIATLRNVSFNQETVAHKLFNAMKLFTAYGCLYILQQWKIVDRVNKRQVRYSFLTNYEHISKLIKLPIISNKLYRKNFQIIGCSEFENPYMRFMDGFRLGQMILGYLQCLKIPKRKTKLNDLRNLYV